MVGRSSLRATGSMRGIVKNFTGADGTIPTFHGCCDFFFQACGGLTNPRDSQVHRALFWAELLKVAELSDFLGDLSVDDVFKMPLSSNVFLIRSISPLSLRSVQIIRA